MYCMYCMYGFAIKLLQNKLIQGKCSNYRNMISTGEKLKMKFKNTPG